MAGRPLDGVLRQMAGLSWNATRAAIRSGKVNVSGEVSLDPLTPVRRGEVVVFEPAAPRPRTREIGDLARDVVVHLDSSVVVVRKPPGISTIPFGDEAPGDELRTLDAMVREVLAKKQAFRGRSPLGVVHRLDKDTSGLLVFTRTIEAKKQLAQQFRDHSVRREYVAIVHGVFATETTFRTYLIPDRGDGLRGSARTRHREGQLAVTHVRPLQVLADATLIACRLETGRTHQIRIHLSEAGHPIVGEPVYIRGFRGTRHVAQRTMLHARELGFIHPGTEEEVVFTDEPPEDFRRVLESLTPRKDPPARAERPEARTASREAPAPRAPREAPAPRAPREAPPPRAPRGAPRAARAARTPRGRSPSSG